MLRAILEMQGMVMSDGENETQHTQHAFLVAWGWFAQEIGLIERFQALKLKQKHYHHTPQTKVLEFLVSILGGLEHLQDISLAAHPLDKDDAVAEAWGQAKWADYSGVSRTLSSLTWEEVHQIVGILDEISQKYIDAETQLIRSQGQRVQYDGDLTGIPVSNTSQSYQNAAFGHMDDEIRLGYQAAVNSMESPTYGRLWLSGAHHPGDTVSCTQAEALVLAAETRTGLRPLRRTDFLRKRIQAYEQQVAETKKRLESQEQRLQEAKDRLAVAEKLDQERQQELAHQETTYQERQRKERPTSRSAQSRKRAQAAVKRLQSRQKGWKEAQKRVDKTTAHWKQQMDALAVLYQRLKRFDQENATNSNPIEASYRLDAGFGTYENMALFIEMGYNIDTKAHGNQAVPYLKKQVNEQTTWTRVGANAEMVAWSDLQLKNCPYLLDVALERFYTGKTIKHSALLHFGADPITQDLPGWFKKYNGRQTIEAGIKESKQVFYLHHIKVRSEPAIYLQERFVLFAANFIRWASRWLIDQAQPTENALEIGKLGIKRQVHVAAHMSAQVIQNSEGKMLKFSEHSAFAGKVLKMAPISGPNLRKAKF
jgi:hypothetical protein